MRARITKRVVDATKPGDRDSFLWDDALRGFGVKITPAGRRVYVLQYRINGRLKRYTIGQHGSWTPDAARKEAGRLLGAIAAGRDPAQEKADRKAELTVAELCELYIAEGNATKKGPTLALDKGRIKRHIVPLLGRKPVKSVTRGDVERCQQDIAKGKTATDVKTGWRGRAIVKGGKGAASRTISLLGAIFEFAVNRGLLTDNPVRGVKRFKDGRRERFLSGEELARLGDTLAAIEAEGSEMPSVITALRLLVLTGARKWEVLSAKHEYVDWEHACLRLPDSKTGQKAIPLGAAALAVIDNAIHIDGNPYICPGEKPGAPFVGLQKAWKRIRARADLSNVRLHDLRHSFASVGASSGDSLVLIGALLGHRDQSTTARYAHLASDPVRAAADRISGKIAAAMRQKAGAEIVPIGGKS